ncbi:MAG TPA: type II secretion system F family protein [Acetobacteraceae bacterium]|nr:type II secretion system F family protein [Acetobacteraceae bacterium]
MPRFDYSALSATGDFVAGELDGPDAAAIIARLHERALLPIHATEHRAGVASQLRLPWRRAHPLRGAELALFSGQLSRLLRAGLPLDRALEMLATLAAGRPLGRAIRETLARVRDGAALAEAMAAPDSRFPAAFVTMIRAGEAGGALQPVLDRAAGFLARSEAIRQKLASALIYPVVLMIAATGSVVLVLTVVLPQFEPMFRNAGAALPASTRIIMALGDFLRRHGRTLLAGVLVAALALQRLLRRPAAARLRDRVLLALPLIGTLVTKSEIGRFCRTLSVLLANGVGAPRAMALCGETIGNRVIADAVSVAATRFKQGEGLSAPLALGGRFPTLATQLLRIGEETGRLEEMLAEVADIYDRDVERIIERALALFVPVLTIAMGAVIALIVASVMTALLAINDLAL